MPGRGMTRPHGSLLGDPSPSTSNIVLVTCREVRGLVPRDSYSTQIIHVTVTLLLHSSLMGLKNIRQEDS